MCTEQNATRLFTGLTNTITAVKNAQMAESPLLLIGGAAPSLLKNRGALQDIDQGVLFRPLCKFTARITKVRDIVPTMREAIRVAQSDTPGPVFIEFPIDVLYPYELVVREMGFVPNAKGFKVRFFTCKMLVSSRTLAENVKRVPFRLCFASVRRCLA